MAKRGYKLQELVAHSDNVNCVSIGKKAGRLFITGGDDHQCHLWSVGNPTSLMSLCGLTSPVGSVAFDSAEVSVAAGSSSGMIKLWDLEEAKLVRTLSGHKASCSAVEFHPFADFFASGSLDTHLKIWDIRKKGCMHTYKGHSQGISTVKFSPDGRWVVSGGFDNVVQIWDLTAGKVLHDFKSHDGHIRSLDFHPLEFLLATGSADKTVMFWDLETFKLIGSSKPELTGVRAMSFHPDGRTLFCGLEDSFKVYSWEPIIRHDAVDMGWSTLGDLCIHDDKLLGCSFYHNSVGVWAADLSLIEPYRGSIISEQNVSAEPKSILELRTLHKQESDAPSSLRSHVGFPGSCTREKTIYVVSCENSEVSKKVGSSNKGVPSESEEYDNAQSKRQSPAGGMHPKTGGRQVNRRLIVPNIVPRYSSNKKRLPSPPPESNTAMKTMFVMPLKPTHARNQPDSKDDVRTLPQKDESSIISNMTRDLHSAAGPEIKPVAGNVAGESTEEKNINVVENYPTAAHACPANGGIHLNCSKDNTAVNVVNGVTVVPGRTRTLVEKFERREVYSSTDLATQLPRDDVPESENKDAGPKLQLQIARKELTQDHICGNESFKSQTTGRETIQNLSGMESAKPQISEKESPKERESVQPISRNELLQARIFERDSSQLKVPETQISGMVSSSPPTSESLAPQITEKESSTPEVSETESVTLQVSESESLTSQVAERESMQPQIPGRGSSRLRKKSPQPQLHKKESPQLRRESPQPQIFRRVTSLPQTPGKESSRHYSNRRESPVPQTSRRDSSLPHISQRDTRRESSVPQFSRRESSLPQRSRMESPVSQISRRESLVPHISRRELFQPKRHANFMTQTLISDSVLVKPRPSIKDFTPPQLSEMEWRDARVILGLKTSKSGLDLNHKIRDGEFAQSQIFEREHQAFGDEKVAAVLMQDHDMFLSTLQSRLTKLQVVHHFWEHNDLKGAINAMKKLPDPSVHADVVSVLSEKMEILNLDLFSCLLPVLVGLLDSAIERHTTVSLDLLLKLVAVFWPMIFATASAPPPPLVGVDLQAEERREWCSQCFTHLQNIQQALPRLIRKGGTVARSAQELNLLLQAS